MLSKNTKFLTDDVVEILNVDLCHLQYQSDPNHIKMIVGMRYKITHSIIFDCWNPQNKVTYYLYAPHLVKNFYSIWYDSIPFYEEQLMLYHRPLKNHFKKFVLLLKKFFHV